MPISLTESSADADLKIGSSDGWSDPWFCWPYLAPWLPCKSPKADPGLAMASPAANFLKLVSLELGRGLDADEKVPPPRPVNPSKLDCLVLAKALKIGSLFVCPNSYRYIVYVRVS